MMAHPDKNKRPNKSAKSKASKQYWKNNKAGDAGGLGDTSLPVKYDSKSIFSTPGRPREVRAYKGGRVGLKHGGQPSYKHGECPKAKAN